MSHLPQYHEATPGPYMHSHSATAETAGNRKTVLIGVITTSITK